MTAQPTLFDLADEWLAPPRAVGGTKRGHARRPAAPSPAGPTVAAEARRWTLTFPAPDRMLSTNTGKHWRVTSPVKKTWREAMYRHAQHAKLPTGLIRVRVDIELRFPTGGRRDAPNYHQLVAKPLVDALGPGREYVIKKGKFAGTLVREPGYLMIPDDTAKYLDGPHLTIGAPVGRKGGYGEVVVTITDLSGAQ